MTDGGLSDFDRDQLRETGSPGTKDPRREVCPLIHYRILGGYA